MAAVLARALVMALCAAGLATAISYASDWMLDPAASFDMRFDRFARAVEAGMVSGATLGGALCWRIGRRRHGRPARFLFSAVAAAPLLYLWAMVALDN